MKTRRTRRHTIWKILLFDLLRSSFKNIAVFNRTKIWLHYLNFKNPFLFLLIYWYHLFFLFFFWLWLWFWLIHLHFLSFSLLFFELSSRNNNFIVCTHLLTSDLDWPNDIGGFELNDLFRLICDILNVSGLNLIQDSAKAEFAFGFRKEYKEGFVLFFDWLL